MSMLAGKACTENEQILLRNSTKNRLTPPSGVKTKREKERKNKTVYCINTSVTRY